MRYRAKLRMRALAAALVSFVINLIGFGLAPLVVGALSDLLRPALGAPSLRYALLVAGAAMLWGGLHFMLGTRHLCTDMAKSAS